MLSAKMGRKGKAAEEAIVNYRPPAVINGLAAYHQNEEVDSLEEAEH
ncbi:MAG: hypothetical protein ABF379_12550 [Akkermansiaceae bacterium]